MLRSPLQPMWDFTIHPFRRPASSLVHHPVFSSNTNGNNLSTPLAASTRERFLHRNGLFPLQPTWNLKASPYGFERHLIGKGFHTECFVPLSNRYRISQSIPLEGPGSSQTHCPVFGFDTNGNSPSTPLIASTRERFLHRNGLFPLQPMWDLKASP